MKPPKVPVKCPQCKHVFAGGKECPACGYVFKTISRTQHQQGELGEFDLKAKRISVPKGLFIKDILRKYNPAHKPAREWEIEQVQGFGLEIGDGPFSAWQMIQIKLRYNAKRLAEVNKQAKAKKLTTV